MVNDTYTYAALNKFPSLHQFQRKIYVTLKQTCLRLILNQSIPSRQNVEIIRLSHTESLESI